MMGVIVGTICCMISGATVWGGFGIVDGAVHRTAIMEGLLLGVYLGGGIGVIVGMIVGMVMGGILGASARGVPLNEQAENRRTIMPPFAWILVGDLCKIACSQLTAESVSIKILIGFFFRARIK